MDIFYTESLKRLLKIIEEEQHKDISDDMRLILDMARDSIQDRINLLPHRPKWKQQ